MVYELLIVDDEYQSRNTLATCFPWKSIGFHIAGQAYNGTEALQFLETHKVHVILCDIKMPGLSGIELAQILYSRQDTPMIIFLSSYRDFEYAQQAIKYNVRYYIVKPASYEELYETFTNIHQELDARHSPVMSPPVPEIDQDLFLHKIKAYIEENYRTATLTEISSILYMNSSYVSQLFKQKTGRNFIDYLQEVRMKKAACLLEDPSTRIYDISNHVGYVNPKNFARAFRSYYGKTPKEYRESFRFHEDKGEH